MTDFVEYALSITKKYSDKVVFEDSKNTMTFGDLDRESASVYAWLKEQNVGKNDFVQIVLERGVKCCAAMLGVWRSGAAFVILEKGYPEDRIEFIKSDVGAKCVIDDDAFDRIVSNIKPCEGFEKTDIHDSAFAVYTSGSTGNPKGVIHEYGNLELMSSAVSPEEYTDKYYAFVPPLYFVAAIMIYVRMFLQPRPTYIVMPDMLRDFNRLKDFIEEKKVSEMYLPPSYIRIYKNPAKTLETVITGSEQVNGIYYENGTPRIINRYSMSESGLPILQTELYEAYDRAPLGRPVMDIDVHLVDENGQRIEGAGKGEICFRNQYVRGYIGLEEKTRDAFIDGIYHTGDIAERDEEGMYYLVGRKDDMFKINGNRVEPSEIERRVNELTGLNSSIAKGFKKNGRDYICLYFLKDEAKSLGILSEDNELIFDSEKLKTMLTSYMIPTYYVAMDKYPLSRSGKVVRRLLEEPETDFYQENYVEPEDEIEKAICHIMKSVLNIDMIGALDDFYLIGGDSVSAIQFVSEAAEKGFDISVNQLYRCRTPRALKEYIVSEAKEMHDVEEENKEALTKEVDVLQMQSLWTERCETDPNMALGLVKVMYRLKKDVDIERFKAAVDRVFRHHPILLTRFIKNSNGVWKQRYDENIYEPVKIIDITEEELKTQLGNLGPDFNMAEGRLHFRAIYKTEEACYFYMRFHHILVDGSGIRVINDNIYKAYSDINATLPMDYYYYIIQKENNSKNDIIRQEMQEYIDNVYVSQGNLDKCEGILKTDLNGPDVHVGVYPDYESFKNKGNNGNLYYMTACAMAMAKCNNENKALLYWAYSGRDDRYKSASAGGFVKYLPFYLTIEKGDTPKDLLKKARDQSEFSTAHCIYFKKLLKDTPEVSTMIYLYQKDIYNIGDIKNLVEESIKIPMPTDKGMGILSLMMIESQGSAAIPYVFYYSKDYYKDETAKNFHDYFKKACLYLEGEEKCF